MRKLLVLFLSFVTVLAAAQGIDANTAAKAITAAGLKEHLSIIASAEMQGRETGTEGERKAAAYLTSQYKKFKLKPGNNGSYSLPFTLYQDKVLSSTLKVNGEVYTLDKDYWVSASSVPQKALNTNAIIFVGNDFNDKSTADVKGKLLVATESKERSIYKIMAAQKLGALGIIIIASSNPSSPSNLNGRLSLKPSTASNFVSMTVSKSIGSRLLGGSKDYSDQELADVPKGVYTTTIDWTAEHSSSEIPSADVMAVLPSKEKTDEYMFVTSHYDHEGIKNGVIYYGADDDGSGTASVVAIAQAFAEASKKGFSPKRNIVFMNVSGEEKGLLGSQYYSEHPVYPLEKTSVDLNIDMVGRIDPTYEGDSMNYVYLIGEDKLSSDLQPITDKVNKNYNMELDRRFNDPNDTNRFYYRSDHYNFAAKGVPVIFYFNGTHADYHKPTDTVEKINFDLMEKRVRIIFETAWEMATREDMLKRDLPLNMPGR
ncbi:MAG: M28 family metallopeptidase [Sediminibacterium sp.]|nr:M28 family metallopeptidase [Sediminibacterium sp.]